MGQPRRRLPDPRRRLLDERRAQLKIGGSWALYKKAAGALSERPRAHSLSRAQIIRASPEIASLISCLAPPQVIASLPSRTTALGLTFPGPLYVQDNWRVNSPADPEPRPALGWSASHIRSPTTAWGTSIPIFTIQSQAATIRCSREYLQRSETLILLAAAASPGLGTSPNGILAGVPLVPERNRHRLDRTAYPRVW